MTPVLAFDLGGTKILAALVVGAEVIDRAEVATAREAGPEAWIDAMAGIAAGWRGRYGRLGVTVTGLVRGGVWNALNPLTLPIPRDYPLAARLCDRLGMAAVIANDAQAAAWGEFVHGAGRGRDMVFLTVSTGIGGGVVLGGRLVTGRGGLAGSFGQLGPVAEAGGRAEDIASGRWIAAEGRAADARAVFAEAAVGDARAAAVVAQSAARVGRLCANLQLAFDPAVIVIGGGVGLAPGYLDLVRAGLGGLAASMRPEIVPAALGSAAGAIGIAALAATEET